MKEVPKFGKSTAADLSSNPLLIAFFFVHAKIQLNIKLETFDMLTKFKRLLII